MKVVKRDGRIVDFDKQKILAAIEKANAEVKPRERANKENIKEIVEYITGLDKKRILVEDIQDIIEEKLMEYGKYFLAKKYITYRYTRELVRKANTTDQSIKELIDGESEYWNNENSNKNARVVTTQRDYLAGITSTDITRRFLLPKDVVEAHDEGIIHFHDADYFAQNALHNCDLINLEDMLQNGTSINGVMIEKPHRFLTAMTIATQIITAVNSSQYGGVTVTMTHLAPFVRESYKRILKKYQDRKFSKEDCEKYAKEDLAKEGLFDESHKKKIPLKPKIIGVLSSQTGAVIRDIINVSTRRNPNCYIRLLPVPVQGPGAAKEIVKGIETMNEKKLADVIILARGGGSLEDLWPFNEEIVARAIYNSEIPIISAVGHETDFTIADFVSDLRAPTPSAAAELANPDIYELKNKINTLNERARLSLKKKLELMKMKYQSLMNSKVFTDPIQNMQNNYLRIDGFIKRLENSIVLKQKGVQKDFKSMALKLDALSPLKTMVRGFSIIEKDGKIIKSSKNLEKDDEVSIKLIDGNKQAKIM